MPPRTRLALVMAVVMAASFVLGGLTAWAQLHLPAAVASFANSCSGWALLTALLVAWARPSPWWGAALGVGSFVLLVQGYAVASHLRGHAYDPTFWSVVGVAAGPFVGAAAAAVVGHHPVRIALGAGALAGVLAADGIYGLTVIADTTSAVYWSLCLVGATVLLALTALRLRASTAVALLLGSAVAATAVLSAGYAVLDAMPYVA